MIELENRLTKASAAVRRAAELVEPEPIITEETAMRNRPVLVVVGALVAVALVVGIVAVMAGAGEESPVTGEPATSTEVPATTTTVNPSDPPDLDAQSGELAPGSYAASIEPFLITITVPDGWQKHGVPSMVWGDSNANVGFQVVEHAYADPCRPDRGFLDPPIGPTVDDLVAFLSDIRGVETSAPVETTVDGYLATYLELTDGDGCPDGEALLWEIPGPGAMPALQLEADRHRLWIVDVVGRRLVVTASDRTETTPTEFIDQDRIIESIEIDLPGG